MVKRSNERNLKMERGLANKKVPKPQFSMPIIWVSLQKEGGGEAYEMFVERYISGIREYLHSIKLNFFLDEFQLEEMTRNIVLVEFYNHNDVLTI